MLKSTGATFAGLAGSRCAAVDPRAGAAWPYPNDCQTDAIIANSPKAQTAPLDTSRRRGMMNTPCTGIVLVKKNVRN
jgi:hypothetical protein